MNKLLWLSCALSVVVLAVGPSQAYAEGGSPERLAARCIAAADQTADRLIVANDNDADKTVPRVRYLVAKGHIRKARKEVAKAIARITRRSNIAAGKIRKCCNACIVKLMKLRRPDLARKVRRARDHQIGRVRTSQRRTIARVKAPLPG